MVVMGRTKTIASVLGVYRDPVEACPCCGRPPGTVIPRPNPYRFDGTDEEWRQLHLERTKGRMIHQGRPPMMAADNYCSPAAPCNACQDWAREQLEKRSGDGS